MKSKIFLFSVLTVFLSKLIFCQVAQTSVSNILRYGTGKENIGEGGFFGQMRKEYLENLTDVRLFYPNVTIGFLLELSKPPEYGLAFQGIREKYIEFQKDDLTIRAGDVYKLFSRGLSLNLFKNRQIAYDTKLEGIRAEYSSKFFKALIIGGEIDFIDPTTLFFSEVRKENYTLRAASLEFFPMKKFKIGGNFVWSEGKLPNLICQDTVISQILEIFARLNLSHFDVFASYAWKQTEVGRIDSAKSNGFYASISHSGSGYGITLEYKDYRFDVVDPFQRASIFRPTRMLPFQNPPTLHREHSYTLLSRYPHTVDFNDEVGYQVDAFVSLTSNFILNLNFAASSKHYAYTLNRENFSLIRKEKVRPIFPSFANELSPFWEVYSEFEYSFLTESFVKLGFNRRSDINYEIIALVSSQPIRTTTIPFTIQYELDKNYNVKFISESQWVYKFPNDKRYYSHLFYLQLAKSSEGSIGIMYETTTSKYEPLGKKNWLVFEGSYRVGSSHTIFLSFGKERGGQVCSSGICRTISPFEGFRFSMINNF